MRYPDNYALESRLIPIIILWIITFVCANPLQAQTNEQITQISIVKNPISENVSVNGINTSVYGIEVLDSEPDYPGGVNGLMAFLLENLVYPTFAMENGIQGRVVIKFVVTTTGNVANAEVVESVDPALDDEAIRVVSMIKGFSPGVLDGKKVNVWYTLPIKFKLPEASSYEEFDAVAIDSIGYQEMMDLGLAAQKENNLAHATAYFKEAFHINPYSIDPLERIVKLNNANWKSDLNYDI